MSRQLKPFANYLNISNARGFTSVFPAARVLFPSFVSLFGGFSQPALLYKSELLPVDR